MSKSYKIHNTYQLLRIFWIADFEKQTQSEYVILEVRR